MWCVHAQYAAVNHSRASFPAHSLRPIGRASRVSGFGNSRPEWGYRLERNCHSIGHVNLSSGQPWLRTTQPFLYQVSDQHTNLSDSWPLRCRDE